MAITALNVAITTPEMTGREQTVGGKSSDPGVFFADLLASLGSNLDGSLPTLSPELATQGLDSKIAVLQKSQPLLRTDVAEQPPELAANEPAVANLLAQLGISNTTNLTVLSTTQAAQRELANEKTALSKKEHQEEATNPELNAVSLLPEQIVVAQPAPPVVSNTRTSEAQEPATELRNTLAAPNNAPIVSTSSGSNAQNLAALKSAEIALPSESPVLPAANETSQQSFANVMQQTQATNNSSSVNIGNTISVPVSHQAAWSQQVGERIILMSNTGQQTAELHLTPSHLGPMQITLSINQDQTTSAIFVAHHPETRQAIQDALPQLREMFSSAGLSLGQTNVSSQSQQQQNNDSKNGNSPRFSGDAAILAGDSDSDSVARVVPLKRGSGVVDLFA